jgi:hypothetical protein
MTSPITLQRLEGAVALVASLWFYHLGHGNWWLFTLLLLTPDITMLGYFKNNHLGAAIYNLGHSYLIPGLIALIYLITTRQIPNLLLIWFAHIALDHLFGYGLKEPTGFRYTHLGPIGHK